MERGGDLPGRQYGGDVTVVQANFGGIQMHQAGLVDLVYVCRHMDLEQRLQIEDIDGSILDPELLAANLFTQCDDSWVGVESDGTPLFVGGFDYLHGGVYQDWLITRPEAWTRHAVSMTKVCRRMIENLLLDRAHRVQAMVLAERQKVRDWYRLIGYEHEGTLKRYTRSGKDVVIYARTN
jgi:RimJ/RimL family protein N-acetyltransferase